MSQLDYVRYRGKDIPVLETIVLDGKKYPILEKLTSGDRRRYKAYDRSAKDFRQILVLPRRQASYQHLRVLQRLSQGNPNLPTILHQWPKHDEIYLVTTWVRGVDLETFLADDKSGPLAGLSLHKIMRLYRGLAHGLSQMHLHQGVVHADIKPSNLVHSWSPSHLVMVDFGSAWTVEKTLKRETGDGLSHHYAAPEQLQKKMAVDWRADQFSATVVAFRMLTGELPYSRMGGIAGLPDKRPIYEPRYQPPSRLCPLRKQLPKRVWRLVDEVVGKALALDADRRYADSGLWLDALEDIHCEMRRRARFHVGDRIAMKFFGRFFGKPKSPANH